MNDGVRSRIREIRGQRVILDRDLAEVYGVPTGQLNQQLKRNRAKFPDDFAFQLTDQELTCLISQIVISKKGRGGVRKLPWAFTEHGAIMAASVLNSPQAVTMSVFVVRAFVELRNQYHVRDVLAKRLDQIERKLLRHDTAPQAKTRGFLITEFGLATRTGKDRSHLVASHATWDVGYMRNVGAKTAIGGTLFLSTDDHFDEAYFIGLKPRFRYWLWRRLHADISAGLILTDLGGRGLAFKHPGVVGHVGIGYGDWGSVVLQYEGIRYNYEITFIPLPDVEEHNWYLGVNVGSYPGAILGPLALAALILVRNAEWD